MRRFYTIGGQAFCMIAALLLSLSPLSHGLHLASCNHANEFCDGRHPGHAPCAHLSCHRHEHVSEGAERERVAISNLQVHSDQTHDPSTCPFCQGFTQLVQGQGPPPAQAEILRQELQLGKPQHGHTIPDRIAFLKGYSRAPPSC